MSVIKSQRYQAKLEIIIFINGSNAGLPLFFCATRWVESRGVAE